MSKFFQNPRPMMLFKTFLDSGFQKLDNGFLSKGTWILNSNLKRASGLLQLNNGFRSPESLNSTSKRFRIADSTSKNFTYFQKSGLTFIGRNILLY